MFSKLPRAQRRLLLLSLVALALSIVFVVAAIIFATGRPAVREGEYRPFEVGSASALAQAIATERPLFFADPTGGDRGFVLTLLDRDFASLHVIPPDGTADCPVDWDPERERFEDCNNQAWAPEALRRFATTINDDDIVVVDLRRILPPLEDEEARG